ncbi:MAG: hypothetical protein QOF09_2120 [Alphaproteobacteria bacterium]|jgi:hypothetical protein|nr:hypothetical protein [Alphaproteobacteria bacterium]
MCSAAKNSDLILRSPPKAGVSKDGPRASNPRYVRGANLSSTLSHLS